MAAIVGAAGLHPAMAAATAGKRVLLANKETLVMAGNLFMQAVLDGGATLLPIDSEHNAIFQVMPHQSSKYLSSPSLASVGVKRVLLTASGGPFRNASLQELKAVTRAQALNHPNWVMGPKITVDSATLMNKGLEVIEAHWLFNALPSQIDVVDSVSDVITLEQNQIKPTPEIGSNIDASFLIGLAPLDERMLILMDIEKLMSSDDMGLQLAHVN